jgi:Protein of unknown function (DUF4236)
MSSLRFWRRKRIFPGITANMSKSGVSLSLGQRGAHYTVGGTGERVTVGLPGSGLFVTEKLNASKGAHEKPLSTSPFRTDYWGSTRRAKPRGFLYVLLRVFAWMVIAVIALFSVIVIVMHAH